MWTFLIVGNFELKITVLVLIFQNSKKYLVENKFQFRDKMATRNACKLNCRVSTKESKFNQKKGKRF